MADETDEMLTDLQDPVLDRRAALERIGDAQLLAEIAAIFLTEQQELVEQIRTAYRASNPAELERAAHNLKGSVSNFGALPASQAAFRLERMAREGNLHSAEPAIRSLEQQLERLRVELVKLAAS